MKYLLGNVTFSEKLSSTLRYSLTLLLALYISGCASPTSIHIYAKYFEDEELQPLVQVLQENEFYVQLNKLDIPVSITENAILHSLLIEDPTVVDRVWRMTVDAGFVLKQTLPLTRNNHWYTKNSLALILFPEDENGKQGFFAQDLHNEYQSSDCDAKIKMRFYRDGTYELTGLEWSEEESPYLKGRWIYRQYPYIELRGHGMEFSHIYFEINQDTERDQISEIEILNLRPLEDYLLLRNCSFKHGKRVRG